MDLYSGEELVKFNEKINILRQTERDAENLKHLKTSLLRFNLHWHRYLSDRHDNNPVKNSSPQFDDLFVHDLFEKIYYISIKRFVGLNNEYKTVYGFMTHHHGNRWEDIDYDNLTMLGSCILTLFQGKLVYDKNTDVFFIPNVVEANVILKHIEEYDSKPSKKVSFFTKLSNWMQTHFEQGL